MKYYFPPHRSVARGDKDSRCQRTIVDLRPLAYLKLRDEWLKCFVC